MTKPQIQYLELQLWDGLKVFAFKQVSLVLSALLGVDVRSDPQFSFQSIFGGTCPVSIDFIRKTQGRYHSKLLINSPNLRTYLPGRP